MTTHEAERILIQYNAWRRDNEGKYDMIDPEQIVEAIEEAITTLHYINRFDNHKEDTK